MPLSEAELQAYQERERLFHELQEKAKWNICAVCEGMLVVRWWQGQYDLACGKDKSHMGIKSWRESA